MFLSRIQLNPVRRGAQQLLTSPHSLHAAVLSAFPDPSPNAHGRVLWRLDTNPYPNRTSSAGAKATLYVVSPERPDFTHLAEQAGWPSLDGSWQTKSYDSVLDRIENGQHYSFRLTANPVRSSPQAGERGKIYGHVTTAQQEQWLLTRQQRAGFAVDVLPESLADPESEPVHALVLQDRRTLSFSRRETRVTLRVATFEGLLTVTDQQAFVAALCHGIGRAKGYGCGLMTIAPAT